MILCYILKATAGVVWLMLLSILVVSAFVIGLVELIEQIKITLTKN